MDSDLIRAVGWTLTHSIWQISAVTLILAAALRILASESARVRYAFMAGSLVLCLVFPAATFVSYALDQRSGSRPSFIVDTESESRETPALETTIPLAHGPVGERESGYVSKSINLDYIKALVGSILRPLFPQAVILWLIGVAIFSIRNAGGLWKLRAMRQRHCKEAVGELRHRFDSICQKLRIRTTVTLLLSAGHVTPIAYGIFRPLVIFPAGLLLQMNPAQVELLIAHELIHIRRYDHWFGLLLSVAESIFFYHPCIWWLSRRMRREREFAADYAVTTFFENSHIAYATALVDLEEIRRTTGHSTPGMVPAANGGNLMQRISTILDKNSVTRRSMIPRPALLSSMLLLMVMLGGWALFRSDPAAARNGEKKMIAIGFVSIPPVDRSNDPPKDADATARLLIAKLKSRNIPAIGFLNGTQISDGEKLFPVRAEMVRKWRDAGLEIGIGNFKHVSLYDTPLDEFTAGVEKNRKIAQKLLGEKGRTLTFFSYPYLNTGNSLPDRDRFESWLTDNGLRSVKYTIDNQEWMYSFAYDMARNDNDVNTMKEVRAAYLKYMEQMFDHFEAYSKEMFGRDIAQSMVLTPSRLVADTADEFFDMVSKRGYDFVSMKTAQSDPAYKERDIFVGRAGVSWFERWAITKGISLRDEPNVDLYIRQAWKSRKSK